MIKSYKKSEIPEGAKFVEIVKVTSDEVLGLVSNEDSPNTIMTTDDEVPSFILEGDIFLYADFIIRPCAAKMAPIDSPAWDDPLFKGSYCRNDLLLIRKICDALES